MSDLQKIEVMAQANWTPAATYWKAQADTAQRRIEQLERELAEVTKSHEYELKLRIETQSQLAAEKALADRLYLALNDMSWMETSSLSAYRKARGL